MCLGIPMRVLKADRKNNYAVADNGGLEVRVNISLIPEIKTGDYLMVHAGFAIARVDVAGARESLVLWKELLQYADT